MCSRGELQLLPAWGMAGGVSATVSLPLVCAQVVLLGKVLMHISRALDSAFEGKPVQLLWFVMICCPLIMNMIQVGTVPGVGGLQWRAWAGSSRCRDTLLRGCSLWGIWMSALLLGTRAFYMLANNLQGRVGCVGYQGEGGLHCLRACLPGPDQQSQEAVGGAWERSRCSCGCKARQATQPALPAQSSCPAPCSRPAVDFISIPARRPHALCERASHTADCWALPCAGAHPGRYHHAAQAAPGQGQRQPVQAGCAGPAARRRARCAAGGLRAQHAARLGLRGDPGPDAGALPPLPALFSRERGSPGGAQAGASQRLTFVTEHEWYCTFLVCY